MGALMLNFKRIVAFLGNMEKNLHALCTPSGSEMPFLCRSGLPALNRNVWKEKMIPTYQKLSSCLSQDYAGGSFACFR